MIAYLVRKLVNTIPTVLGVALLLFVLLNVVGGDPAYQMLGRHASAQQLADVRREYGFDQPLPVQFGHYLKQIVTFDYGHSYTYRRPITEMIRDGIGPSLSLLAPAFFLTTVLAVFVALLVSYYRGRWIDRLIVIGCVSGMSLSILAYVLFGQYVLAYKLGLFPISGYETHWPDRIQYLMLPVIIWISVSIGHEVRFYRTAILEEVGQDYVRTARAKGLDERAVFLKHVLKNSLVPIVTNVVLEIPLLVLGSFVLESFFSIPGLGNLTIEAFHNSDFPVIKAMATFVSLLFILGNVATDIVYTLVDPRVELS